MVVAIGRLSDTDGQAAWAETGARDLDPIPVIISVPLPRTAASSADNPAIQRVTAIPAGSAAGPLSDA